MPVAPNQDMFENEECNHCGKPGVLVITRRGTYTWRCPQGGYTWYRVGSKMDIYNELIDPWIDDNEDGTDF